MLVIGLTGGIGSGKTTTASFFAKLGVPIIDADVIARRLTDEPSVLKQLSEHFGPFIVKADKSLDRMKLRHLIFTEPQEKKWLEKLLHPLITLEITEQLEALEAKATYCIVVIPLLFETGPYPFINRILVIESPEEIRIERTQLRDKASEEDVKNIIKTQATSQTRIAKNHELITNNSSLNELETQVLKLHQAYLSLSKTEK